MHFMATADRERQVDMARAALIVAAMRRSLLTYAELGAAIGMRGVNLRNQMRHVLDALSVDCHSLGEPSLAALVVNQRNGEPGSGWSSKKPWHWHVQRVFEHWASPPA
jgi:hypothetical protein